LFIIVSEKSLSLSTCQGESRGSKRLEKSLSKTLLEYDSFPTTGYEGELQGKRFVITHPDLKPPVQVELHP